MFSQSADEPAADESPAPIGMRELPPQPAKPVMPAFTMPAPAPAAAPSAPLAEKPETAGPGPEDSVIAADDHLEGTFTSRGTVVVMGSVKGRIEAVQVRVEDGARVDADVIVDEAIIAGEFTGNLTCRERLEARASGRINGRVETFRLMLHEGASVEGEMHMLTERPRDASETIRGSAPLRGEARRETRDEPKAEAKGEPAAAKAESAMAGSAPAATGSGAATATAAKAAPTVTPSSAAKPAASAAKAGPADDTAKSGDVRAGSAAAGSGARVPTPSTAAQVRASLAQTLRTESLRVAPRATTSGHRHGSATGSGTSAAAGNGSKGRGGSTPTGF